MDIGTAKPPAVDRARVRHHLVDLVDPDEKYSAARFRDDALRAVADIFRRGRVPLLVGGTMLYYRALVAGIDAMPAADAALREAIDADAGRRGWPALHAELARVDPRAAARIAPGDAQRIQRALEVWRLTGRPISSLQTAEVPKLPFSLRTFALAPGDRAALHRRIAQRFDAMLAAGLIDEVIALRSQFRLGPELPSMRCVGYRQVWEFLEGSIDRAALREKAIAATRQLAKRQYTWLRSFRDVEILEVADPPALAARFT
jgi:tRNA dimethylallyltransferase